MLRRTSAKTLTCTLVGVLAASAAGSAAARGILIDFNDFDPSLFQITGQAWPNSSDDGVDVRNDGTASGTLPFGLLIGSTTFTAYCLSENGEISFAATGDACAAASSDSAVFSVLGADWVSSFDGFATNDGDVSVSLNGLVDRVAPFDAGEAQNTVRFLWNGVTLAGGSGDPYYFQALIYDLGGGDFDLQFNYGFGADSYAVGFQRITAGGTTLFSGTSPFSSATDYDFSFRAGELGGSVTPPPTTVPEPGALTLLVAGAGLLWGARSRSARKAR